MVQIDVLLFLTFVIWLTYSFFTYTIPPPCNWTMAVYIFICLDLPSFPPSLLLTIKDSRGTLGFLRTSLKSKRGDELAYGIPSSAFLATKCSSWISISCILSDPSVGPTLSKPTIPVSSSIFRKFWKASQLSFLFPSSNASPEFSARSCSIEPLDLVTLRQATAFFPLACF